MKEDETKYLNQLKAQRIKGNSGSNLRLKAIWKGISSQHLKGSLQNSFLTASNVQTVWNVSITQNNVVFKDCSHAGWFSPSTTKSIFYIYWLTFSITSITYLDFINWFRTWFYYMSVYRLNQLAETCLTCREWMFSLHDVFVRVKLFLLQISVRTAWLLSQLFTAEICQTWLS